MKNSNKAKELPVSFKHTNFTVPEDNVPKKIRIIEQGENASDGFLNYDFESGVKHPIKQSQQPLQNDDNDSSLSYQELLTLLRLLSNQSSSLLFSNANNLKVIRLSKQIKSILSAKDTSMQALERLYDLQDQIERASRMVSHELSNPPKQQQPQQQQQQQLQQQQQQLQQQQQQQQQLQQTFAETNSIDHESNQINSLPMNKDFDPVHQQQNVESTNNSDFDSSIKQIVHKLVEKYGPSTISIDRDNVDDNVDVGPEISNIWFSS